VAFQAVDSVEPLGADDLDRLGEVLAGLGRTVEAIEVMERACQAHLDRGAAGPASRSAFWLREALILKGDFARAGGWLARVERLIDASRPCAQRGYLLLAEVDPRLVVSDVELALEKAVEASRLGTTCRDRDLTTLALQFQGWLHILAGRFAAGLALHDEAMVAVATGETSPRATGLTYCSVIDACQSLHELRRAKEWTAALNAWCDTQPDFSGAYSGFCRIHRSELLRLTGEWADAVREAQLAVDLLSAGASEVIAADAFYQLAEVHRLRGESDEAEQAFARSSQHGRDAQPGLALLRLAQGKTDAASAAIRRALLEADSRLQRSRLLPPFIEIMLAVGDVTAARDATKEFAEIADELDTPALQARLAYARGAVHLSEDSAELALPALRQAWRLWRDVDVPYETARSRVLVGIACRRLGDEDSAAMELDAAREAFRRLGAAPDLDRVEGLIRKPATSSNPAGLSAREIEVLRLVAAGKTNQAIAAALFLSEKTVARHVSNILTKLQVGSRTAAAAYAFEHGLR
jgi:DNA-binding CsgD family transcriptional regulator